VREHVGEHRPGVALDRARERAPAPVEVERGREPPGRALEEEPEVEGQRGRVAGAAPERALVGRRVQVRELDVGREREEIVNNAKELRSFVVSRLVKEADSPDARIRLKALQMIGNVTEVALFTERTEVKHTDMTPDDVEKAIREKLAKFALAHGPVEDAKILTSSSTDAQEAS
jgi:hypothetical protein